MPALRRFLETAPSFHAISYLLVLVPSVGEVEELARAMLPQGLWAALDFSMGAQSFSSVSFWVEFTE